MKIGVTIFAVLCFICTPAIAENDCESEYANLLNELKESNMLESDKQQFRQPLEKALQLCKEGKVEQASKIVKELKNQGLAIEVFESPTGN